MNTQTSQLFSLIDFSKEWPIWFGALFLIFARFLAAINLTPYLGTKVVPNNIKMATAIAFTAFTFPIVYPNLQTISVPQTLPFFFILLLKEIFFGTMMGLINSFIFHGIESAGSMVDNQRSVANARLFNPALGAQTSLFGIFYYQLCICVFIVMGGHRYFIKTLVESFDKVPIFSLPKMFSPVVLNSAGQASLVPMLDMIIHLTSSTLVICLQLCAPVLIAIFVADLILGITNRIAPMINVFEMGFNIKGFVGVLLVYLSLPLIISQSRHWFLVMFQAFDKMVEFFR